VIGVRIFSFACAALLLLPRLASAQPESSGFDVALHYSALPECPDASALEAIVTKRLGFDPFSATAARRVLVRIQTGDRGLEGHVEWRDSEGKWVGDRTFPSRSDDCRELVRAMGFALAVQIQLLAIVSGPDGAGAVTEPSEHGKVEPPPRGSAERPPPPPPKATSTELPAARGLSGGRATPFVGAGASLGFGLASRPVPLLRLATGVAWRFAQLELGAEFGLPVTTRRDDGAGFSQAILLASLAGCGAYDYLSACLLTKAGTVHIAGRGVDAPASALGSVLEVGVRLAAHANFSEQLYLGGRAEGLLALSRWTVTLDDASVWSAPPFAAVVGVDFGVRFP
jgi:hypothetical protein